MAKKLYGEITPEDADDLLHCSEKIQEFSEVSDDESLHTSDEEFIDDRSYSSTNLHMYRRLRKSP